MAVVSGLRFNPKIKPLYQRFTELGKSPKVAITACMRRMLVWLNAILRNRTPWNPKNVFV
jgi:transposase